MERSVIRHDREKRDNDQRVTWTEAMEWPALILLDILVLDDTFGKNGNNNYIEIWKQKSH